MLPSLHTFVLSTFFLANSSPVSAFWRLLCDNPVTIGRYDPLVNPGAIAGHVHTISGGSGFGMSTTYEQMRNASCTSCQVAQDLSNYWIPQLYYQNPNNGSFEDVPTIGGMTVYYLQRGTNVKAFPPGFKMLAGTPNLRSWSDVMEQAAINFVCLDYTAGSSSSTGLPTKNCPQGLRAQIVFPSCWNGKDLDSANHKSHMAYPDQLSDGNCPADYPVRLVTLFYEVTFIVDYWNARWYSGRAQPFVFAQGDATGYGLHGDFINGWDQTFLQSAVDTCTSGTGIQEDCKVFNFSYGAACHITPQINEVVSGNLTKLPGCNPVTFGPDPAAAGVCSDQTVPQVWNQTVQYEGWTAPPSSHFLANQAQTKSSYSTWNFTGCYSDQIDYRTFPANVGTLGPLTVESCLDSCANNNYAYGGIENGQECWCGNSAPSDRNATILDFSRCATVCSGDNMEICGGGWALTAYTNTAIKPPSIPQTSTDGTAKYVGCFTDNANRIMSISKGTTNGTVDGCVNACQLSGYPYSGLEYMGECYCSASMPAASLKISDKNCNMMCSGNRTQFCGAGYTLQIYNGSATTAAQVKQSMPYAGCFTDSTSARSLKNYMTTDGTIDTCLRVCKAAGYGIAGLEYGKECWCDNVVGTSMKQAAETDCNMSCSGNSKTICGGSDRLSVYNSTALVPASIQQSVAGQTYAGCWTDDAQRVMTPVAGKNASVSGCIAACQERGYTQSGLQYGGECYCGQLAARSTRVADSQCSMTCNDDPFHLCGAGYRMQVYNATLSTASLSSSRASSVPIATANGRPQVAAAAVAAATSSTIQSSVRPISGKASSAATTSSSISSRITGTFLTSTLSSKLTTATTSSASKSSSTSSFSSSSLATTASSSSGTSKSSSSTTVLTTKPLTTTTTAASSSTTAASSSSSKTTSTTTSPMTSSSSSTTSAAPTTSAKTTSGVISTSSRTSSSSTSSSITTSSSRAASTGATSSSAAPTPVGAAAVKGRPALSN